MLKLLPPNMSSPLPSRQIWRRLVGDGRHHSLCILWCHLRNFRQELSLPSSGWLEKKFPRPLAKSHSLNRHVLRYWTTAMQFWLSDTRVNASKMQMEQMEVIMSTGWRLNHCLLPYILLELLPAVTCASSSNSAEHFSQMVRLPFNVLNY